MLVAFTGAPALSAVDDPPVGLVASTATLARVHSLFERAHPSPIRGRTEAIVEDWRLSQDGLNGTIRTRRFGRESRTTTTLGPFSSEAGVHAGTRWLQTRNGMTVSWAGLDLDAISEHVFAAAVPGPDIRVAGEAPILDAYVIEVNPAHGRHEWFFIDRHSGWLVRKDRIERNRRYVITYDDFRPFDGTLVASRIRTVDSLGNESDQTLIARTFDTVEPHVFEAPPNRRTLVDFPSSNASVRLPVRVVNGLLVARANVNGHSGDFLLDSGSSGIAIDTLAAEGFGLERYGTHANSTVGAYTESASVASSISLGALRLNHVAVRLIPIPFRPDAHTRIVGLLGFDFFADVAMHVDYERGIVDAYPPGAFRAPDAMTPVPVTLGDRTPAIHARVANVVARLRIDTGANRTLLFSAFANRPDVATTRLSKLGSFAGVGGTGRGEIVRVRSIEVANASMSEPIVEVSDDDFAFENADGLLGADLLRNFDLWFDYRAGAVYVRRFRQPTRLAG